MNAALRPRPAALALPLLAAALLLLPTLALYPLFDVDEGAFSEATREMLRSGDWLSTTLNGAPRYDKPILIYWLQALAVLSFGPNEFAVRLPSALAGLAWVAAVGGFAVQRLGTSAGVRAAWVAATSVGVMAMSRAATADALLNALLAATLFDAWRHLEDGSRPALRRAYFWTALGVLAKGPIALLIPLATVTLFCASTRRWREGLRAALDPVGWLILAGVAGPWYAAQLWVHGREFVDGFLVKHNLDRFGGTLEGHGGGLWYYAAVLPVLLLPWSLQLAAVARGVRGEWRDPLGRFLLIWFAFVFVFFSFSGTKLPHYLLYGTTPLFVLLARRLREDTPAALLFALPLLLLALLPALPTLAQAWLAQAPDRPHMAFYAAQFGRAPALAGAAFYGITGGCLALGVAVVALGRVARTRRAALLGGLLALALGFGAVPWVGAILNDPVRDAARASVQLAQPVVLWDFTAPSFSFYRGAPTAAGVPRAGELALTRIDRLDPALPLARVFQEGGVVLVRRLEAPAAAQ